MTVTIAAIATGVALLALLWAEKNQSTRGAWMSKPLASTGFLVVAVAVGALETTYGQAVLVGLVFSWFGDVLLIAKARASFLAGLVAFLLGHVAYVVAFGSRGVALSAALAAAAAAAFIAAFVWRWLRRHVDAGMRRPVIAYIVVITAMVTMAAGTFAAEPDARLLAGALAFYASDLAVARDRFVCRSFVNRLWGLPTYYGAQLLLAWSTAA